MKKMMLIKSGLMAMAAVGIIATATVDVRCESGLSYYTSLDEFLNDVDSELNAAGYTKGDLNGGNQSNQSQSAQSSENKKKEPAKACEHTYVDKILKEPSCAEDGEMESTCSKCGSSYKTVIAATGKHTYSSEVTKEPSCIDKGEMTYTCTVCGDTYTEEIPVIDHEYEGTVTKEAKCTEAGEMTYTCKMCEDSYTEEIPATGHTPEEPATTKEAGWFTEGEEVVVCSSCGEVLETSVLPSKYPISYLYAFVTALVVLIIGGMVFLLKKRKNREEALEKTA